MAAALLDDEASLATCAMILAVCQRQWEATNPGWSLRSRPGIRATLYQIGFSRSRPHQAPRANVFGESVARVHSQPWLGHLLAPREDECGAEKEGSR